MSRYKNICEAIKKELEKDGLLENEFCQVWFDDDHEVIRGIGKGEYDSLKLYTSGKKDIYKSWSDVVMAYGPNTTLEDVRQITSKFGYTFLE